MAVSLTEFCKQLTDTDLVAEHDLARCLQKCESAGSDEERVKLLAKVLVKEKLLTLFQVQQVYAGKAQTLFLGSYVIEDKLGEGGMGMVFRARHQHMDRHVAIKVLSPKLTKNADLLKRFRREVKALAALSHGNIVIAYDAGEARGIHFLAMQYVAGTDLSSLVKSRGPLSVHRALDYMIQAGRGLQYAHERSIIHRDVKPANMLLDAEGVVRILDMGLASFETEDVEKQSQLTATGQVMGTVDFMAPEQALNTRDADARSDIYSLGCSVYYLLTGKAIYNGDTQLSRLMAHQSQPIPPLPPKVLQQCPQLEAVYRKLVAKQPQDRYQSMAEALAALESCRSSELPPSAAGSVVIPPQPDGPGDSTQLNNFLQNLEAEAKAGQSTAAPDATVIATQTAEPEETFIGTSVEEPTNATGQFSIGPAGTNRTRATEATRLAGVPAVRKQQRKSNSPASSKSPGIDEAAAAQKPATDGNHRKGGGRSRRGVPKFALIAAGCLGLLILPGIIIRIKNKDGSVTKIKVPDGGNVEIVVTDDARLGEHQMPVPAGEQTLVMPDRNLPVKPPAPGLVANTDWENLFDGQTAVDWETLGPFAVKDGLLVASSSGLAVTQKSYSDFDLEFEWRLTPGGNSGVYYRADAAAAGGIAAYPGTEYQLLDNAGHTDGNNPKTSAGALYGVLPASNDFTRPVGDWNASRITARGGHVEHWMNGQRIVTYDMESPEWKNALTEAKNPQIRTNVSRLSGQIMLQGHSGEIAFRKIRVRQFDVRSAATSGVRDALRFQGNPIKDYVELPPAIRFDDQQPGAAELWIERRQATRGTVMMLVGDGQLLYLQLTRGNKAQLVVVPKQQSESLSKAFHFSGGELPPGRIHLAASWNGKGGYHYYVNGTSYSSGQEHVFQFNEFRTSTIGVVSDEPQAPEPQFIDISQVRISTLDRYPKKFVPEQDLNADSDTLALYDFSQGSGDVLKDASGHGHDGKIIGANWVQTGEANEAQSPARQAGLHFDGVDDYVHVPSLEFTGAPLTMEAWITPDRDAWRDGGSGIIGWDWRARLSLDTRNGETGQSLFGQVWSPDKKATTTPTLHWGERSPGGQLRHVAMVINSDEFQLFQDGRRNSSGPAGLNGLFTQSTSGYSMDHFVLGAAMTAAIRDHKVTSYFAGTIHAARVSKSLRYRANFVPAELTSDADTIALYDFSQGSGDILKDISGHGHDGKIIGATWVKPAENDSDAAAGTAEKEAVK